MIRQKSYRTGKTGYCGIQTRIKLGALSVSLSFLVESFIFASSINSSSTHGDTAQQDAILSFFDLWALVTILALYFQGVNSKVGAIETKKKDSSKSKSGMRTKTEMSRQASKPTQVGMLQTQNTNKELLELEVLPTPKGGHEQFVLPSPSNSQRGQRTDRREEIGNPFFAIPAIATGTNGNSPAGGSPVITPREGSPPEEKTPLSSSHSLHGEGQRPILDRDTSLDGSHSHHQINGTLQGGGDSSDSSNTDHLPNSTHGKIQKIIDNSEPTISSLAPTTNSDTLKPRDSEGVDGQFSVV